MLKTLPLPRHLGIWLLLQIYEKRWETISLRVFKASFATNNIEIVMMFTHQITSAAFHFVTPTEKFAYKSKIYF